MENRYERSAGVVLLLAALAVFLLCLWLGRTVKEPVPKKAVLVWSEGAENADA